MNKCMLFGSVRIFWIELNRIFVFLLGKLVCVDLLLGMNNVLLINVVLLKI